MLPLNGGSECSRAKICGHERSGLCAEGHSPPQTVTSMRSMYNVGLTVVVGKGLSSPWRGGRSQSLRLGVGEGVSAASRAEVALRQYSACSDIHLS